MLVIAAKTTTLSGEQQKKQCDHGPFHRCSVPLPSTTTKFLRLKIGLDFLLRFHEISTIGANIAELTTLGRLYGWWRHCRYLFTNTFCLWMYDLMQASSNIDFFPLISKMPAPWVKHYPFIYFTLKLCLSVNIFILFIWLCAIYQTLSMFYIYHPKELTHIFFLWLSNWRSER